MKNCKFENYETAVNGLERMREHLAFRVFRLKGPFAYREKGKWTCYNDHPIGCCASPPDECGGFWVGAGPLERAGLPVAGKVLVAYECVRQGHGARRSGRTLGVPLRGMASVEFELELDSLYSGL